MKSVLALLASLLLASACASSSDAPDEPDPDAPVAADAPPAKGLPRRQTLIIRQRPHQPYRVSGMLHVPVAIFDADGTLRVSPSGKAVPATPTDIQLLPCVAQRLAEVARDGYFIAVVSNQVGVPRATAEGALGQMVWQIIKQGGVVDYYDYAETAENSKPNEGMIDRLEEFLQNAYGQPRIRIDRKRSFLVGDSAYQRPTGKKPADLAPSGRPGTHWSNVDRIFAERLFGHTRPWRPNFFEPAEFFGWRRRAGVDVFASAEEARKFAALPDACCDVTQSCAGDSKAASEDIE
ncbi:MAG TPA: hypothetical protein VM598_10815 [Bdellovibrionota bacterium]|nr:hypothetical protein [Bdellovibrionota bacterium]